MVKALNALRVPRLLAVIYHPPRSSSVVFLAPCLHPGWSSRGRHRRKMVMARLEPGVAVKGHNFASHALRNCVADCLVPFYHVSGVSAHDDMIGLHPFLAGFRHHAMSVLLDVGIAGVIRGYFNFNPLFGVTNLSDV